MAKPGRSHQTWKSGDYKVVWMQNRKAEISGGSWGPGRSARCHPGYTVKEIMDLVSGISGKQGSSRSGRAVQCGLCLPRPGQPLAHTNLTTSACSASSGNSGWLRAPEDFIIHSERIPPATGARSSSESLDGLTGQNIVNTWEMPPLLVCQEFSTQMAGIGLFVKE